MLLVLLEFIVVVVLLRRGTFVMELALLLPGLEFDVGGGMGSRCVWVVLLRGIFDPPVGVVAVAAVASR